MRRGIVAFFAYAAVFGSVMWPMVGLAFARPEQAQPQLATAWGEYAPVCCNSQAVVQEQYNLRLIERQGTGTVQVHFNTPTSSDRFIVVATNLQSGNQIQVSSKTTDGFWLSTGSCECRVSFVVFGG